MSAPHRVRSAAPAALLAAACLGLGGCGFFTEPDTVLSGERIALRATPEEAAVENREARLPRESDAAEWRQSGGSAARSVGNIKGKIILDRVWSRSIGKGSGSASRITAPPVADDRAIYALDAASQVTALDLDEGDELWQVSLTPEDENGRDGFGGGLALTDRLVIVTTGFGQIVALSKATGEKVWAHRATAPIRSAPALSEGFVVVVARDGSVMALAAETGRVAWEVAGVSTGAAMLAATAPAVSGEVVAAPFSSGDLGIFRLDDGRRGWSETLGAPRRGTALSLITDVSSPPVMALGRIFAGGVSGRVVAFDIPTGRRIWARDLGAYNPVWVAGSTLYLVTAQAQVMALSARDGKTIWETQLPRYRDEDDRSDAYAYGGPIMVGGKLFLSSTDEIIYRLDAATGRLESDEDLPGPSAVPPIFAKDRLYVLDYDGDLHAYE